ncbi:MAG: C40 family peptidase [Candidatus Xenobia bacterium]
MHILLAVLLAASLQIPSTVVGRVQQVAMVEYQNVIHREELVSAARRYLGVPYVWGGESAYGFDCSGFTSVTFAQLGITLPRAADAQFDAGKPVAHPNVGDLVFFTTYLPGPSHVGIYIGNDRFIHASCSHGVTVSNLHDQYFASRYLGARTYF